MIHALEALLIGYVVFAIFGAPLRGDQGDERGQQGDLVRVRVIDHRHPGSRPRR